MKNLKGNVFRLILFIAAIALGVMFIIDTITTYATLGPAIDEAWIQSNGAAQPVITKEDFTTAFTAVITVVVVISAIFVLFSVLCGLKYSMQNKWFAGALVFGILYGASEIYNLIYYMGNKAGATLTSWISIIIGIVYFIAVILLRISRSKESN